MFKEQKGITLVALVITIIVLLILAGVSIALVLGNNGVLTQAKGAVAENKAGAARQAFDMAVASCETDYLAAYAKNTSAKRADYYSDTNGKGMDFYLTSSGYDSDGDINLSAGGSVTLTEITADGSGSKISITYDATSGNIKSTNATIVDGE